MEFIRRTWAEIDLDRLAQNVRYIQQHLPARTQMMGVVKANAYGHGDVQVSLALQEMGVRWFGVSNLEEAVTLRKGGVKGDILILGFTSCENCRMLDAYHLTQTVFSPEYAAALNTAAVKANVCLPVHIKLDTGMSRIGFAWHGNEKSEEDIQKVFSMSGLSVQGMFTHFSHADSEDPDACCFTQGQLAAFRDAMKTLRAQGMEPGLCHVQNSVAVLTMQDMEFDLARPGIILYGLDSNNAQHFPALQPVMALKSVVSMVKSISKGTAVSYGRTFCAEKDMTVATIPIGYADGYFRCFSNCAEVLIHGHRAKVIGRICMDQMVVDITGITSQVKPGDVVTLFGKDGGDEITVAELAELAGTINHEIVCAVARRVPRVYIRNGKPYEIADYLQEEAF